MSEKRVVVVQSIGKRFTPDTQQDVKLVRGSKAARRMLRRASVRGASRIEQKIAEARKQRLASEQLATNSHEAKRYVELERMQRQHERGEE